MYNSLLLNKSIYNFTDDDLDNALKALNNNDLIDFKTRFTICDIDPDSRKVYKRDISDSSLFSYFSKRSDRPTLEIGIIDDTSIILNGNPAKKLNKIGTIENYHYYNCHPVFAGVIGELISQLPKCLKESDKPYYITYKINGFTFGKNTEFHVTNITYYEDDIITE